jgi:1,4-alpha-glucan branching enzyme
VNRIDPISAGPDQSRALDALLQGSLSDPFAVLGPHPTARGWMVRAFLPGATAVECAAKDGKLLAHLAADPEHDGLFAGLIPECAHYVLRIHWPERVQVTEDPYAFGALLSDLDLHLFSEGSHWDLAHRFGANITTLEGVEGVRFAVWAPNARRVSVVGYFNNWDGRRHAMRLRHSAGVWEIFIPRLGAGERYKYEIIGPGGELLPLKADPLARAAERPPATASVVAQPWTLHWMDLAWMEGRAKIQAPDAPISIYEVHAGSWLRPEGEPNAMLDWRGLAQRLIPYVSALGFTHVEFLPIMEHPFGGSWGYQPLSQFAPSARYGEPQEFAHFVDACHRANIGVILDWVPGHFPSDPHGLAHFDGTALYEHTDAREGFHRDWNTLIYNLGRREVQGFLIASALYWLREFHVDGLRVDAVASMLYRDYSRQAGEWVPNVHGGRENLEAIEFLRRLNATIAEYAPGAITIAEESTAWPGVTAALADGGLGFSYKWNMGWMHDTLSYLAHDPIHRPWHHNDLTFGLLYAFSERFILPLSHDEVVHGKGSLYGRAPGDPWQKRANLRAYFGFMWTHPGKKLLFMGGEIGQKEEWSHDGEIAWDILNEQGHAGIQRLIGDLNRLYAREPALNGDADPQGFRWIVGDDAGQSVYAYARQHDNAKPLVAIINMTPVPREHYRIGVPFAGRWREIINTDAAIYGGANLGNAGGAVTEPEPAHGFGQSLSLILPPLAALILQPES